MQLFFLRAKYPFGFEMGAGVTTALTAEGSCGDLPFGLAFPMSMFADRSDELCGHLRGGGTIENNARIRVQRRSLRLGFHHFIRSEQCSGHQCRGFACGGNCLAVRVGFRDEMERFADFHQARHTLPPTWYTDRVK